MRAIQLAGIHHLTAITADAPRNYLFYTRVLGMRLVKKTVNQDDTSAYHLFYADGKGTPGTDLTFFDWPAAPERRGTRSIVQTGLRVRSAESLRWWRDRLQEHGVSFGEVGERDGRQVIDFEDFEGQRLSLVAEEASGPGFAWGKSPVPAEHQILGLGPITISVPELEPTDTMLRRVLQMRRARTYSSSGRGGSGLHVYEMGEGGAAAELHVAVESGAPSARPGAGGVHHVAFRAPSMENYGAWAERLVAEGIPMSGPVDRFYFRSLYFREPSGILFEIATDEPGFTADEPLEMLGEELALPPFLEPRRAAIEEGLKPLPTRETDGD